MKELEKFITKRNQKGTGVLPDGTECEILVDHYEIPIGDLINDFVKHKNKPFWKRDLFHKYIEEWYIKRLNVIKIHHEQ